MLDPYSRLTVSWSAGSRDADYADASMRDVASRLTGRVHPTTGGPKPTWKASKAGLERTWTMPSSWGP